ncbi:MAG: hypothetical protein AB7I30_05715 [Isosphaeraceae bacterium]
MHRSRIAITLAATLICLARAHAHAAADEPKTLEAARARLTQGDAPGAASLLEAALPGTRGDARTALLGLLAESYEAAARTAEAEGRKADADEYRENLAILRRVPRRATPPPAPAAEPPAPAVEPPAPAVEPPAPVAEVPFPEAEPSPSPSRPEPPPEPTIPLPSRPTLDPSVNRTRNPAEPIEIGEPPAQEFVAPLPPPRDSAAAVVPLAPPEPDPKAREDQASPPIEMPRPRPNTTPSPSPEPVPDPTAGASITVEAVDAAFLAKRYEKAGEGYDLLNREGRLPRDRRDHWAYCRAVAVVRRINARPANPEEWKAIDAEIEAIRALSPSNWFAEYLRNRAAERNPDGHTSRSLRPNQVIVRGSSPEEVPPPPGPLPNLRPAAPDASTAPVAPPAGSTVNWSRQPIFSTNFQVTHVDADRALAERVAAAAEAARAAQLKRWGDPARGLPWSPRCEVVLFPTATDFSRETGQPADSPGYSTMGMNEGRVVLRRVLLRVDHPTMLKAVLPHEVTHVVLADLFPQKQIPRWADEGMAVLAEPGAEQRQRASELNDPLASGRLFRLSDLMTMDYPESRHWALYYAQSVSLTRFLVESESPETFVRFVRSAQESGFEPALKQVYRIGGYDELQSRWLAFARSQARVEVTASAEGGDPDVAKAATR